MDYIFLGYIFLGYAFLGYVFIYLPLKCSLNAQISICLKY